MDCFKIGAKLKRDRNCHGCIAGDRFDRRTGLVRRQKNFGNATIGIAPGAKREGEPGMAELERFALPAVWKPFTGGHCAAPMAGIARPVRVGDYDGGAGASISAASACRSSRAVNCPPCSSSSPFLKGTALRQVDMQQLRRSCAAVIERDCGNLEFQFILSGLSLNTVAYDHRVAVTALGCWAWFLQHFESF
jgi:hypothetical protein